MLRLDEISVAYDGVIGLDRCSVAVGPGDYLAVLGANGAGKSSLLNVAARLVRQRSGHVVLDDHRVDRWRPDRAARAGIALVPEGRRLFTTLSVRENLLIGAARVGRRAERAALDDVLERIPELVPRLDIAAARLSGGEQQLLAIGRALAGDPRLLLVDELSLGLAPAITRRLHQLLRSLCDAGLAVVAVEQRADIVLEVADSAVVLHRGAVVHRGGAAELRGQPGLLQAAYLGDAA